jgi:hypothetical protein
VRVVALRDHLDDQLAIEEEPCSVKATTPSIHPQDAEVGKLRTRHIHHEASTFAIIAMCCMHHLEDQPIGINKQVSLAPLNFLMLVQAPEPPFSIVLTD